MSFIYQHAPVVSLVAFFLFFVWVAFSVYRPSAKKKLQEHALIPLVEDNHDR